MKKTLALVSDLHLDEPFTLKNGVDGRARWQIIFNDIIHRGIKEIVFLGDLAEGEGIKWFFNTVNKYPVKLSYVLGNHDDFLKIAEHQDLSAFSSLEKLYYATEEGNYKFIYLDSSAGHIDDQQFKWFEEASNTHQELIVFIHHPILDCSTKMDEIYPLEEREKLASVLRSRNQHTHVFCGHYHIDHVRSEGLVTQIITPAGSLQLNPQTAKVDPLDQRFGYRILTLDNDALQQEVIWF